MSSDEQKQILKMVEDGKISADEAMKLIKALESAPAEDEIEVIEAETAYGDEAGLGSGFEADEASERDPAPEFETVKKRARRFAMIPMWIGIAVTVLSSYWLFTLVRNSNYGFWFACAWFPLLLGILLLALAAGGLNSRWLYVNVEQEPGEWPQHITFGLPLPLGLLGWLLRNFGQRAGGIDKTRVDHIVSLLATTDATEPLIVNVDEGERGERVQVYIG